MKNNQPGSLPDDGVQLLSWLKIREQLQIIMNIPWRLFCRKIILPVDENNDVHFKNSITV